MEAWFSVCTYISVCASDWPQAGPLLLLTAKWLHGWMTLHCLTHYKWGKKDGEKREMTEGERNRESPPNLAWTSGFKIFSTSSVHSNTNRKEWYFQYAHAESCRHLNTYIYKSYTHRNTCSQKLTQNMHNYTYILLCLVFPRHTEKWRGCLL